MKIEYYHASKYGNGAMVADEFKKQTVAKGVTVNVYHIRQARPKELAPADLYVFSSPGRMGKPIGGMRRFLKKVTLPAGTKYALLTTELAPKPDKKTGRMPTEEELARWQRITPSMNEILQSKGLITVVAVKVLVTGIKGPLEMDWQKKVESFVARLAIPQSRAKEPRTDPPRSA
jgi:menaquinone-dependent protoporphyrinogen IX oxidase